MKPHPLKEVKQNYSVKNNKSTFTPATDKIIMRIIIIIVFIIIIILFYRKRKNVSILNPPIRAQAERSCPWWVEACSQFHCFSVLVPGNLVEVLTNNQHWCWIEVQLLMFQCPNRTSERSCRVVSVHQFDQNCINTHHSSKTVTILVCNMRRPLVEHL